MLPKRGSQARKSQSMKFLHRPLVVYFHLRSDQLALAWPTLLLSGAVEEPSRRQRFLFWWLRSEWMLPARLVSPVVKVVSEGGRGGGRVWGGGRGDRRRVISTLGWRFTISKTAFVCSVCPLFVIYFLTYKIIFLTLFIPWYFFSLFFVIF